MDYPPRIDWQNDIGYIKAMVENLCDDMSEVKADIKENIKPVVANYSRDRNFILGICATVSAFFGVLFGGLGKAIAKVFHVE